MAGWVVTAFQPSCQMPRVPSIEKNWVARALGRVGASKLYRMLMPWIGVWVTPPTASGCSTPTQSSSVGTRSMAWWYCSRTSPCAVMPAGQEMMHGSQVPPLKEYRFHILNGVLNAIAHPDG